MLRRTVFLLFIVSGFCSLLYQVVWVRLAMAAFGVNTTMVAIVLSVFMAGLAAGSWGIGRVAVVHRTPAAALRAYGAAEVIVATSAWLVPFGLSLGRTRLFEGVAGVAWGSVEHYLASALVITVVLGPFCVAMGTTFPLGMSALAGSRAGTRSFSYLYLANVVGACAGCLVSAFALIEILGFRGSLGLAATMSSLIGCVALAASLRAPSAGGAAASPRAAPAPPLGGPLSRAAGWALFGTGCASMGMEVVWVRQFSPYLGTEVYAFALVVALYLAATFAGSSLYRRSRHSRWDVHWGWVGFLAMLPLVTADPRIIAMSGLLRLALGIMPVCAALGYFTPMVLDRFSGGEATCAGRAYAINVLGCILGPLLGSFLLLPWMSERMALFLLSLPLWALGIGAPDASRSTARRIGVLATALAAAAAVVPLTRDYANLFSPREVRRDATATVVATGTGSGKHLLVNGIGMTYLTPITKYMAHLPMAFAAERPRKALVLCFGMGVTFRSLYSWGADVTAVELVPSVPQLFGYYHPGEDGILQTSRSRVIIDDARRFLQRSGDSFDVITIDPPPPISAAGTSLLYSREFYTIVKSRLRPGGVLQHWLPGADRSAVSSITGALLQSFPHVRAFLSVEGWGAHFLASMQPIPLRTAEELSARLPAAALRDLVEWGPARNGPDQMRAVLAREIDPGTLIFVASPALSDDRPVNEYYRLRQWGLFRSVAIPGAGRPATR